MKEIRSHTNEYIKEVKSLKYKKYRDALKKYVVEGAKIILEALEHGQHIECILTAEKHDGILLEAEQRGVELISVPYDILQQVSDTKSPPKELAVLKIIPPPQIETGHFFIATDDINDPKNLGAIIRTADAAGADGVFVSGSSADIYGPKVQRAAMGSTFHLPIEVCDLPAKLKWFKSAGGTVISGHLAGSEELGGTYGSVCLVIGNEARGISDAAYKLSDELYKIRIYGHAESLNASVAAGIMMYDIRRRLKEGN